MGILGGKLLILFLLIAVGLGVMISGGWVTYSKDSYNCLGGKRWYTQVDKQRAVSIGSLNFYYQPYSWGCIEDRRFNPNEYSVVNGIIEPKQ